MYVKDLRCMVESEVIGDPCKEALGNIQTKFILRCI